MEKLSHLNLWNLLLVFLGAGLLAIVSTSLMHPLPTGFETTSGDAASLGKNWHPSNTIDRLAGDSRLAKGIDIELIAQLNPFKRVATEVEPLEEAPPVPKAEQTPPPVTRPVSVIYRGYYRSSGGDAIVYAEVEGTMRVISIGQQLLPSWKIDAVNASQLVLRQGEDTPVLIPFNRKKDLEVPIE